MGYSYSDPAEVICDESYYPILAYKTWCQADGQWSPYGTCERKVFLQLRLFCIYLSEVYRHTKHIYKKTHVCI